MANDQLTRIEEKLDGVVAGQATLEQGQVTLIGRVTALEHGQTALVGKVTALEHGQTALVGKVTALEQGQAAIAHGLEEVQTHLMRVDNRLDKLEVNAEAMRDDIKQIAEGHAVTQAAVAKSTETVVAHIDRKIEPIERAVRALFGSRL